jgi:hypothetical protein
MFRLILIVLLNGILFAGVFAIVDYILQIRLGKKKSFGQWMNTKNSIQANGLNFLIGCSLCLKTQNVNRLRVAFH